MEETKKKTNKLKSVLRTLALVVLALFIGLQIYSWNASSLVGNQLPMPFGYGAAVVLTGSMEPNLPANSLIFVKETDSFAPGDIVVYQSGGSLVVHRVISIDGGNVITQGDANNAPDEPAAAESIKGTVIGHIPYVGAAVRVLKTPVGSITVIVVAFLLIELSYRKERQSDEDELEQIKAEIRRLKDGDKAE